MKSEYVLVIPLVLFPSGSIFAKEKEIFISALTELKEETTLLKSELFALKSSFIALIAEFTCQSEMLE